MSDDISIMIRRLNGPAPSIPAMRDAAIKILRLVDERDEWKAKHDDIAAMLALERRYARDPRRTGF